MNIKENTKTIRKTRHKKKPKKKHNFKYENYKKFDFETVLK